MHILIEKIDALLPQTQCRQCGYHGCRPYAEALARGAADINQCPPGGAAVVHKLAALLGRDYKPLDPAYGVEKPRTVARIHEPDCIGCTLCIQACPVDAIAGAPKFMHTVIEAECTGCELCLPPCPVDCIQLLPAREPTITALSAQLARQRARFRIFRLERTRRERAEKQQSGPKPAPRPSAAEEKKRARIQAAIARAREKQAQFESQVAQRPVKTS